VKEWKQQIVKLKKNHLDLYFQIHFFFLIVEPKERGISRNWWKPKRQLFFVFIRRFFTLPPVPGSGLFCSRLHSSIILSLTQLGITSASARFCSTTKKPPSNLRQPLRNMATKVAASIDKTGAFVRKGTILCLFFYHISLFILQDMEV
jgi:hypothetical protein